MAVSLNSELLLKNLQNTTGITFLPLYMISFVDMFTQLSNLALYVTECTLVQCVNVSAS